MDYIEFCKEHISMFTKCYLCELKYLYALIANTPTFAAWDQPSCNLEKVTKRVSEMLALAPNLWLCEKNKSHFF